MGGAAWPAPLSAPLRGHEHPRLRPPDRAAPAHRRRAPPVRRVREPRQQRRVPALPRARARGDRNRELDI